uniref:B-cell lymphoma 9 beta-catenin binding domain-containing protein n=1 Tax=Knipowitschia caucasica TaxID=637954 RepID=A0AAV2J099_KNICA
MHTDNQLANHGKVVSESQSRSPSVSQQAQQQQSATGHLGPKGVGGHGVKSGQALKSGSQSLSSAGGMLKTKTKRERSVSMDSDDKNMHSSVESDAKAEGIMRSKRRCVLERKQPYSGDEWCSGPDTEDEDKPHNLIHREKTLVGPVKGVCDLQSEPGSGLKVEPKQTIKQLVYVFTTNLANSAADAVLKGQSDSILLFHQQNVSCSKLEQGHLARKKISNMPEKVRSSSSPPSSTPKSQSGTPRPSSAGPMMVRGPPPPYHSKPGEQQWPTNMMGGGVPSPLLPSSSRGEIKSPSHVSSSVAHQPPLPAAGPGTPTSIKSPHVVGSSNHGLHSPSASPRQLKSPAVSGAAGSPGWTSPKPALPSPGLASGKIIGKGGPSVETGPPLPTRSLNSTTINQPGSTNTSIPFTSSTEAPPSQNPLSLIMSQMSKYAMPSSMPLYHEAIKTLASSDDEMMPDRPLLSGVCIGGNIGNAQSSQLLGPDPQSPIGIISHDQQLQPPSHVGRQGLGGSRGMVSGAGIGPMCPPGHMMGRPVMSLQQQQHGMMPNNPLHHSAHPYQGMMPSQQHSHNTMAQHNMMMMMQAKQQGLAIPGDPFGPQGHLMSPQTGKLKTKDKICEDTKAKLCTMAS